MNIAWYVCEACRYVGRHQDFLERRHAWWLRMRCPQCHRFQIAPHVPRQEAADE